MTDTDLISLLAASVILGALLLLLAEQAHLWIANSPRKSKHRAMLRAQRLATLHRLLTPSPLPVPTTTGAGRHAAIVRVEARRVPDDVPDLAGDLPPLSMKSPSPDELVATMRAIRAAMPKGWQATEARLRAAQERANAITTRRAIGGAA